MKFKRTWNKLIFKYGTPIAIIVGCSIIAASIILSLSGFSRQKQTAQGGGQQVAGKISEVSADDDPVLGDKNAPITMIEFSDFQCPFCRKFWRENFTKLKENYIDTGKVKLVYRDFPLPSHPMSSASALAGECAHEQGKFWEFHDKIFSEQDKQGQNTVQYGVDDIKKWVSEIGLSMQDFNSCFDSGKYNEEVKKDLADGQAAGVAGTPTSFVNGVPVPGAQTYSVFEHVINAELKK